MADCEHYLRVILTRIEPSSTQKAGASRSHNFLRELLATGNMSRVIFDSYLSGSYARDTAIAPLDDVDIIFLVNPEHWLSSWDRFLELKPSPASVLDTFANAIRRRYDQSSVHTQRRSVCLRMNHLDIDVVPAMRYGSDVNAILIADAKADEWIVSAPKKHEALASKLNLMRDGNFKPLVKLLKFWNSQLPSTANLKSFAIETMAAKLFTAVSFRSLEQGLLYYWDFVSYLGGNRTVHRWENSYGMCFDWFPDRVVPDTAGTGSNLIANASGERLSKFVDNAERSRTKLLEARNSIYTETTERRLAEALRL